MQVVLVGAVAVALLGLAAAALDTNPLVVFAVGLPIGTAILSLLLAHAAQRRVPSGSIPASVWRLFYVGTGGAFALGVAAIATVIGGPSPPGSNLEPQIALSAVLLACVPLLTMAWDGRRLFIALGAAVGTVALVVIAVQLGPVTPFRIAASAVVALLVAALIGAAGWQPPDSEPTTTPDRYGTTIAAWSITYVVVATPLMLALTVLPSLQA